MADNAETRRARELLKSSAEALERARNRPRYTSSWIDRANEPERTVTIPVVRKVREDAAVSSTMDAETQAKWDAWAKGIARKAASERALKLIHLLGETWLPPIR